MSGLQGSLSKAFFCKGTCFFCLELKGTVQWQGEGARDVRTAKAFETQGSPSFYHSECHQRDSVDKKINCVTRNRLNRYLPSYYVDFQKDFANQRAILNLSVGCVYARFKAAVQC